MKPTLITFASVADGLMKIHGRKQFDNDLKMFNGQDVEIRITKKKRTRSLLQNNFYWGCIIPIVRDAIKQSGVANFNSEQTHELLKFKCNQIEYVNEKTGEIISVTGSTADLSAMEFIEYVGRIKEWVLDYLNVTIPEPGEVMSLEFIETV